MKETGAGAVKIEGGIEVADSIKRILSAGIPVMGHLGLMPQSIHKYGTYSVRAQDDEEASKIISDAHVLNDVGCFAIVLEKIPATLANQIASEIKIPVIGIGAGQVDGQVLVLHDMLGITQEFNPRFLRRYAQLDKIIKDAVKNYINDVKTCDFPNENEQY
jgi:3-methyl-2-oxobutanoate hydroxymethyltransferase